MLKPIAYGSLYMDTGEGFEIVAEQVIAARKKKPKCWYFDVVIKPDEIEAGKKMVDAVFEYIESFGIKAYVALTADEARRPARDMMMSKI